MEKIQIYLCDLCHTAQGMVSEFAPYGVGCLKSYFNRFSKYKDNFELTIFKFPNDLIERFTSENIKNKPKIVAFSNYIWNLDLSYSIAKKIKELHDDIIIIFGGPNYPLEDELQEKWLLEHPAVDLYIIGEAEEPFTQAIDFWYENQDLEKLKTCNVNGCHSLINGKLYKSNNITPRLKDLNMFPSPYTEGYLDEFITSDRIIPLIQTNRGCPFACTFCEKGSNNWTKISSISVDLFAKELEYIAKKTKVKVLLLADNNFGMFKQDIEISKIMAKSKEENDYPYYIVASTGKTDKGGILECVKILKGSITITASVQSMDPDVLVNVKRKNISTDALLNNSKSAYAIDSTTRSELILALPGDTKEKHFNSAFQLVDAKIQFILPYTLILLDGSELATKESREKWVMKTKFRVNHRCFGAYPFGNEVIKAAEIEEVVVSTDTLSLDDYFECRSFDLTTFIFVSDDMLSELLGYLELYGIRRSELLSAIHQNKERFFTNGVAELFNSFNTATKGELWDSKEELLDYLKSLEPMKADERIIGYNVMFRHKAFVLMELVDDIIDMSFKVARELLAEKITTEISDFLTELKTFMILRKRNVFDFEKVYTQEFNYNFSELMKKRFEILPEKLNEPEELTFYHTSSQKKLFKGFSPGLEGVMRIIPRLSLATTYRTVKSSKIY